MQWRTHVLAGVNTLWLIGSVPNALTADTLGPLMAASALGALLPDLDAARSKVRALSAWGIQPFAPPSQALSAAFGHRGLLHSPLGWLGFGAGCLALALAWSAGSLIPAGEGRELCLALWLGYGSHLTADACTKSGVPAWPCRVDLRWHLLPPSLRIVTGSFAEERLLPLLALPILLLVLRLMPHA